MTIDSVNSNVVIPLYRGNGVSSDTAAVELNRQQQTKAKNALSEDRMSKVINDSSVYANPETAYVRPQYQRMAPVAPSESSDQQYLNTEKYVIGENLVVEEAEYYVEEDEGFSDDYEFPQNIYEPKGYYITLSKEHVVATYNQNELSPAEALKQKFYADEIRTGNLINVMM